MTVPPADSGADDNSAVLLVQIHGARGIDDLSTVIEGTVEGQTFQTKKPAHFSIKETGLDERLDEETFRIVIELSKMDGFDAEKIARLTGLTEEVVQCAMEHNTLV